MGILTSIIRSGDPEIRNCSLDEFSQAATLDQLLDECADLEQFRRSCDNLYEQVRACFFLHAIYRYHIPLKTGVKLSGKLSFDTYEHFLSRRFEETIRGFLLQQKRDGLSDTLASGLAAAYARQGFQTLADQVRRSVKSVRGNQWMFRVGHPLDQPLRFRKEILTRFEAGSDYPIIKESTPVRMDLSHSAWSDIFFLGMDYPEGARVLNVSVDLAVRGNGALPRPPVEAYLRVIDEPIVRLASIDLGVSAEIDDLDEIFDFAKDYLGLLKAALIASGIIPPGLEGSQERLGDLLERLLGAGRGIELVSSVNGIPKGSRLAVSTNLLAALITACMRATGQVSSLEGELDASERSIIAARAIFGEWLAGSGGGWQDSGGVWPGIKLIEGDIAREGDPEFGISRGRLMPRHTVLGQDVISAETRQKLQESLVLVHGGMAQNVGPILEMVTEKYLLRSQPEWEQRQIAINLLEDVIDSLRKGDIKALGSAVTRNFFGPLQSIIPWASTFYTENLIRQCEEVFGGDFWGFWMLGGMSGGGMGFIFAPERKAEAQERLFEMMLREKTKLEHSLPFAMNPVVYDFAINEKGTVGRLLTGAEALLPAPYYAAAVPDLVRLDPRDLPSSKRTELNRFADACRSKPELSGMVQTLFDRLLPHQASESAARADLAALLKENGFDPVAHEHIRAELKSGRIGLAQNRLPITCRVRDVESGDVYDGIAGVTASQTTLGAQALSDGTVAVVTLAAGVGSRWTQGAGVVKALHPFAKLGGRHRTFLETHLAKSRKTASAFGASIPHIFTTSYLTDEPMRAYLAAEGNYGYEGVVRLSRGQSIGLRMTPTVRDLRFAWEDMPQQKLDAQAEKMRTSLRSALLEWAKSTGEASDYTDNIASQCLHPVGHWYEVPNMLKNGTLRDLLKQQPSLKYLLVHNIDTLGANLDPGILGRHIESGAGITLEVIPRRLEDRGGGLARVDGKLRLVEGLAMASEADEFNLTYYNSLTTWVTIDRLLDLFGLSRVDLDDSQKVSSAVRAVAAQMPTYVTLKDVKKRWSQGHEDIFPVTQFEKLWGDMTAVPEIESRFIVVPRLRGQQLKEQSQLDSWLRDGSARHIESLCEWTPPV